MSEIEDIGRKIERDSANDVCGKYSHYQQVQQEVADLYHGDPAKFQAVLKFMANDTQYSKSLGLTQHIEMTGNDITGLWFTKTNCDGKPDAWRPFEDTESFRHFLRDPGERREARALANSISRHDYAEVQSYLDENASDPAKLTRVFKSFDILNLNVGLRRRYDRGHNTATYTFEDTTTPSELEGQLPSITVAEQHRPRYMYTNYSD